MAPAPGRRWRWSGEEGASWSHQNQHVSLPHWLSPGAEHVVLMNGFPEGVAQIMGTTLISDLPYRLPEPLSAEGQGRCGQGLLLFLIYLSLDTPLGFSSLPFRTLLRERPWGLEVCPVSATPMLTDSEEVPCSYIPLLWILQGAFPTIDGRMASHSLTASLTESFQKSDHGKE